MLHETLDTTRRLAACPAVQFLLAVLLVLLVPGVAFLAGGWSTVLLVVVLAALLGGAYAVRTGLHDRVVGRR